MILVLSILGMLFSLGGNIFIIKKKRIGWLAWIVGNILWILINFLDVLNIPMVCMYVVYLMIYISGYIEWRRK